MRIKKLKFLPTLSVDKIGIPVGVETIIEHKYSDFSHQGVSIIRYNNVEYLVRKRGKQFDSRYHKVGNKYVWNKKKGDTDIWNYSKFKVVTKVNSIGVHKFIKVEPMRSRKSKPSTLRTKNNYEEHKD